MKFTKLATLILFAAALVAALPHSEHNRIERLAEERKNEISVDDQDNLPSQRTGLSPSLDAEEEMEIATATDALESLETVSAVLVAATQSEKTTASETATATETTSDIESTFTETISSSKTSTTSTTPLSTSLVSTTSLSTISISTSSSSTTTIPLSTGVPGVPVEATSGAPSNVLVSSLFSTLFVAIFTFF
ncbi:hypothetical protein HDU92_000140 [Lobulomyces angularis]|nr:hypothetical protein HDU92_000140 [Lobulomyces angularis]